LKKEIAIAFPVEIWTIRPSNQLFSHRSQSSLGATNGPLRQNQIEEGASPRCVVQRMSSGPDPKQAWKPSPSQLELLELSIPTFIIQARSDRAIGNGRIPDLSPPANRQSPFAFVEVSIVTSGGKSATIPEPAAEYQTTATLF